MAWSLHCARESKRAKEITIVGAVLRFAFATAAMGAIRPAIVSALTPSLPSSTSIVGEFASARSASVACCVSKGSSKSNNPAHASAHAPHAGSASSGNKTFIAPSMYSASVAAAVARARASFAPAAPRAFCISAAARSGASPIFLANAAVISPYAAARAASPRTLRTTSPSACTAAFRTFGLPSIDRFNVA